MANSMKTAQLHAAIKNHLGSQYLERILQREDSIDYDAHHDDVGNTSNTRRSLLHVAYHADEVENFKLLLDHGADFTLKNSENHTVVHDIIHSENNAGGLSCNRFENSYINLVLSAHVKFENRSNPYSEHGISHFHAACMTNHVEAVEYFLKNGVPVDETVNKNSKIFAGFTPLHCAAKYSCFETVQILLKHGADVHLRNVKKMSPMNVLIDRKIKETKWETDGAIEKIIKLLITHDINGRSTVDEFGLSNLHVVCVLADPSLVQSILLNQSLDVNHSTHVNSPICPGYTPLHFASLFNIKTLKLLLEKGADIRVKDANNATPFDLCLQKCDVEDLYCIIFSVTMWKDIKLSDDKTRLIDVVLAMKSDDGEFAKFIANIESITDLIVPVDLPLWPGYTILHLVVTFSEKSKGEPNYFGWTSDTKKVEACLLQGAEMTRVDVNNSTALHLAFYLQKFRTVEVLLKHHLTVENPSDANDVSHFHIACAARDEIAVERFLNNGVDVNIPITSTIKWHVLVRSNLDCRPRRLFLTPGSTALHINVACGNIKVTRMLIKNGADVYAKDCNGFTAIHRLFTSCTTYFDEKIDEFLLGLDGLQDSVADCGLSHLHVACYLDKLSAVERLLDSGANINAVLTRKETLENSEIENYFSDPYGDPSKEPLSFLSRYSGFTPMHFSIRRYNTETRRLLIKRNADIFASGSCEPSLIQEVFGDAHDYDDIILPTLLNNIELRNRLKHQLGITMLHIACYLNNLKLAEDLLTQGEDVNLQVHSMSSLWPGNTPLHVTALNVTSNDNEDRFIEMFQLLMDNGADVTLIDHQGDTPIHLLDKKCDESLVDCESARLLLKSLKDFDINTINSQGLSFFHFACMIKDIGVFEKFLENQTDVNATVDYFADRHPGCSPLHFASGYRSKSSDDIASQLRMIDLLLKHGADIRALDANGNNPLHSAASCGSSREKLFDIFIRLGLDVKAENILGETPLKILIKSGNANWEEVECLLRHGSPINSYNPITQEGYITKIFSDSVTNALVNDVIRNLLTSNYVKEVDDQGRNFLHNIVSIRLSNIEDYVELIELLVKQGCNINHRDNEGRTALHIATWFRNNRGVLGLMKNGADVNITDNNGKTAFAYSFEPSHDCHSYENYSDPDHVINTFAMHVHKMQICGLYISEVNQQLQVNALEMYYLKEDILHLFEKHIKKSKTIKIGSTALSLHDFGIKIDTEMVYPNMPLSIRLEIDQFFENIRKHNLNELDYLLKLKHEKARERLRLINLAVVPFNIVIKNELPELCCRVILSFLPSTDLKNVIATEDL